MQDRQRQESLGGAAAAAAVGAVAAAAGARGDVFFVLKSNVYWPLRWSRTSWHNFSSMPPSTRVRRVRTLQPL